MPGIAFQKLNTNPASYATFVNDILAVADTDPAFMELFVVDNAGATARRIPTKTDIESWITTAIANADDNHVAADITARNALTGLKIGDLCLVTDASADATVDAGAATYVYDGGAWVKIAEFESMDVVLNWTTLDW